MASSVFTKIVNGQLESYKLLEEKEYLSFLDISPLTLGHTLVIPKKQVDYIFDLNRDLLHVSSDFEVVDLLLI